MIRRPSEPGGLLLERRQRGGGFGAFAVLDVVVIHAVGADRVVPVLIDDPAGLPASLPELQR